jgi:hypothetical protein
VCGRFFFTSKKITHSTCDDCRAWRESYRALLNFTRRVRELVHDTHKRARYAKAYGFKGGT